MSQRNEFRDIVRGIALLLAIHIHGIVIGVVLGYILGFVLRYILVSIIPVFSGAVDSFLNTAINVSFFAFFRIGITQWLYVIPLLIWLQRRERWGLFKGVLIGALLTMLLNGGCFLALIDLKYEIQRSNSG